MNDLEIITGLSQGHEAKEDTSHYTDKESGEVDYGHAREGQREAEKLNQLYDPKECERKTKELPNEQRGKEVMNKLDEQVEREEVNCHEVSQNQSNNQEIEKNHRQSKDQKGSERGTKK